jgi:DNA-binding response OmpR family regulator
MARLLLVDGDDAHRVALTEVLVEIGQDVVATDTTQSAANALEYSAFDLVLIDLDLEGAPVLCQELAGRGCAIAALSTRSTLIDAELRARLDWLDAQPGVEERVSGI